MQDVKVVPEGLAGMPPGPQLAAVLAGIDLDAVADGESVKVLRACAAQLAHNHAQLFAAMVAVQRAAAVQARADEAAGGVGLEWVGAEIGAALSWTTGKADRELHVAQVLVERLPLVFAELVAGRIDQGRAWTFMDVLDDAELTDAQLERVCSVVVPLAHGLTSGQIRARLLKLLIGIDPGYAARRYRRAVRERHVRGFLAPDGTGVVGGYGLAAEEAVAACERIERLADAVKDAGHPGALAQIRADLFTGLLDGRLDGLTPAQMIAELLGDAARDAAPAAPGHAEAEAPNSVPGAGPDRGGCAATGTGVPVRSHVGRSARGDVAGGDEAGAVPPADPTATSPADSVAASHAAPPAAQPADPPAAPVAAPPADPVRDAVPGAVPARAAAAGMRPGGEIRVGLGTLMHRDDHPGEVPGWGPVLADVARAMAVRTRRGEWRFAITDPDGYLVLAGRTRRRPYPARPGADGRDGIVEIHMPVTLLAELAVDPEGCGEWAGVIADLADQYARRHRLQHRLDAHPHDRFANAALRRHVQIRDRRCVAPGCRRPARRCDLDHTIAREHGGLTTTGNSGPLCPRHHRMKHEGGWRLDQPHPGHFRWTSPLGHTYRTRGEPIGPPQPAPLPRGPDEPNGELDDGPDAGEGPSGSNPGPGPVLWLRRPPPPAPPPRRPSQLPDEPPF